MNLGISNHLFIVCGASSGLGNAIAVALLREGANVIAVARNTEKLQALLGEGPGKAELLSADLTRPESIEQLKALIHDRYIHGALINAGGPPAKTFLETTLEDWDGAYTAILRWKLSLVKMLLPLMQPNHYGRLLFIESASVKQPIENLVLSNSLRLAVVGFVKTLSQEIAATGITLNILAPGSHDTPAIERVYQKKATQAGISVEAARDAALKQMPLGRLGNAEEFASLACWLLSPLSGFITGQTISVDGGTVKGVFG